ncbi:hypothetical protein WDU94_003404 [Cyamophila willieti]
MGRGTIYCCVPSCVSSRVSNVHNKTVFQKDREAITFHQFPKNSERYALWAKKCFGTDYLDEHKHSVPYNKRNTYICSKHFTSDDFTETFVYGELLKYSSKKILKITAVPSLELPDHTTLSVPSNSSIKQFDSLTSQKQFTITKSYSSCSADKSPISEKLRKLREEGQKRIAQLIKENEEIFKCSIHKVNSPACSIENCVLRPKRRKKADYNSATNSLDDQIYCVEFGDETECETYAENIVTTLEEVHAESDLYDDSNNSLTDKSKSFVCLENFKEEIVEDRNQFVDEENSCFEVDETSPVIQDNSSQVNEFQVLQVDKERKFLLKYCGKPPSKPDSKHIIVDGSDFINIITEPHQVGKRLKLTRETEKEEFILNNKDTIANSGVDISEQFHFNTRHNLQLKESSQQLDLKSKENSAKQFTKSNKGELPRQLNLSRTAVCNAHNTVNCNTCCSNYFINSVKSEKYEYQTTSNNNNLVGNALINFQADDKSGTDERSTFQFQSNGKNDILSNPSGGYGSSYRLIRPKTSEPQPNSESVHLVKAKLSNNLDKLKKIDQLITENNILISNFSFDSNKTKPGSTREIKYPLKTLGSVQSADASGSNSNNKENTKTVPPPLVPIGSGTLSQYEQTILEQTNVIQKLVDRINKLEEENERLKRVEQENEHLRSLVKRNQEKNWEQDQHALLNEPETNSEFDKRGTNSVPNREGNNLPQKISQEEKKLTSSRQKLVEGDERVVYARSDTQRNLELLKQGKIVILRRKVGDEQVSEKGKLSCGENKLSDTLSRRDKLNKIDLSSELREHITQSSETVQRGCNSETQKGLKRQERVEDNSNIDCIEEIIDADNIEQSTERNRLNENVDNINDSVEEVNNRFNQSPNSVAQELRGEIAIEDSTEIVEHIQTDLKSKEIRFRQGKRRDFNTANCGAINTRRKGVNRLNADNSNATVRYQEPHKDRRTNENERNNGETNDDLNESIDESLSDIGEYIEDKVEDEELSVEKNEALSGPESHVIDEELGQVDSNNIIEHCETYFVVQSSAGGELTEVQLIGNDRYVGYGEENLEENI